MGKTFRRGGNERGYYSPGKSLRDKRQRGTNRNWEFDDSSSYNMKQDPKKRNKYKDSFDTNEDWA
jgi:hypothetical protein|tara:strand:+ start:565 stop:759 length:195 start_codon:yes stop_codon:yes gene_type:complete